jgi:MFS family permease
MSRARGLAPLRHRSFRLLVGGQLASSVGDSFYAVALPWYVLTQHGGVLLLGTVLAAYGLPRTAVLVVGGHASDRWHPWTVMMVADATRALAVAALAVAAAEGPARALFLVPVAVVLGAGEGLFLPGSMSIIPSLLPDGELQAGNGLSSSLNQVATLIGPALGGTIVALVGPAAAFATDAVSFVISAATLAGVRVARQAPGGQQTIMVAEAAGAALVEELPTPEPSTLRHMVRTQRPLQVVLLMVLAANLASGGLSEVALPALAHGPFHASSVWYGALLATLAAGGLAGTLAAGQARPFRRPAVVGSVVFVVEGIFIALVPYVGSPEAAGVVLALMGATNGFGNVLVLTLFQRWAPPQAMGRLMGLVMLASFGTFPISVLLGGLVVHDFGPAPFFPVAGALVVVAIVAGLTQREWRDLGARPSAPAIWHATSTEHKPSTERKPSTEEAP